MASTQHDGETVAPRGHDDDNDEGDFSTGNSPKNSPSDGVVLPDKKYDENKGGVAHGRPVDDSKKHAMECNDDEQEEEEETASAAADESWKDEDFLSFERPADVSSFDDENGDGSYGVRNDARGRDDGRRGGNCHPQNGGLGFSNGYGGDGRRGRGSKAVGCLPPWMNDYHRPRVRGEHGYEQCYGYGQGYGAYGALPLADTGRGRGHGHITVPPLVLLHNEIVDFARLMEPREDEISERKEVIDRVRELVEDTFGRDRCRVAVFGSQATGLFLPCSDIDLVVFLDESKKGKKGDHGAAGGTSDGARVQREGEGEGEGEGVGKESARARERREMNEWGDATEEAASSSSVSPLQILGDALRRRWMDDLLYLEVLEATRVPIVKFTLKSKCTAVGGDSDRIDDDDNADAASLAMGISVDISFDRPTGVQAAELVHTFMRAMPPLRPLTFVLKYFMASRDINEPYSGGIGSFLLQMMIVSFLQHREREEQSAGRSSVLNLGSLLLDFFELYGVDFNYITTGITVRNDGQYFAKGEKVRREHFWQPTRPFSLAMENPFEIDMDVGRPSYRMQLVQKSFEVAFRTLLSHVSEPAVPAVSILASILPTTEEMRRRASGAEGARRGSDSQGYDGRRDTGSSVGESDEDRCEMPAIKRGRCCR